MGITVVLRTAANSLWPVRLTSRTQGFQLVNYSAKKYRACY